MTASSQITRKKISIQKLRWIADKTFATENSWQVHETKFIYKLFIFWD